MSNITGSDDAVDVRQKNRLERTRDLEIVRLHQHLTEPLCPVDSTGDEPVSAVLANDLRISRVHVRAYECDVGNVNEVRNIFSQVLNDFVKIDVAILNAGASSRADVSNYSSSTAKEIFNANTMELLIVLNSYYLIS